MDCMERSDLSTRRNRRAYGRSSAPKLTTDDHRAVLLAKTPEGYANLCRLLSDRHCDPSFDFHRRQLPAIADGLIHADAMTKQPSQLGQTNPARICMSN